MKMLIALLVLFIQVSFAGDRVGNGGDVLICMEPGDPKYFVLDEYENHAPIRIGAKDLSFEKKLDLLLARVKRFWPARYAFYKHNLENFLANARYVDQNLPDIRDSNGSRPANCFMKQGAYFKTDKFGETKFYVQRKLWEMLSSDQKAILVFHELLYTEAAALGHTSSLYVRMINRHILSFEYINAKAVDELFLAPLASRIKSYALVLGQLKNAYTERIAFYVLSQDLTHYYQRPGLKEALLNLRDRFQNSEEIARLTDKHLRRL